MQAIEFLQALKHHNDKKGGYQIHLNSGNLEDVSKTNKDIEFGDLYFTDCHTLNNTVLLCFGNDNRKPIESKPDGTNIYPSEINNCLYIDLSKIESIEDLKEFEDWFAFPSSRVINIYMFPQNNDMVGNRNVLTIGFME
ncbi:hypothetical protein [Lacrimispora sp.]|uniref:hypothetical protein n=1 Tax=Lacrimispora sp. TaxID=2719234 RepID=UPI00345FA905